MQDIGLPSEGAVSGRAARTRIAFTLLGAACALVPSLAMWGFTVDDALISVRYAQHLAAGVGYRFDAGGPATDGVTPLPWALLLVPLASANALVVLARVKVLGIVLWTIAGAALGERVATLTTRRLFAVSSLLVMALAFPIGAWAASGMETGAATALATFAATRVGRSRDSRGSGGSGGSGGSRTSRGPRGWSTAILAGFTATLRPELVVWALALTIGDAWYRALRAPALAARAFAALAPFILCAVIRLAVFGRPAPLAVLAKPSDFEHGALYASAGVVTMLLPLLVLAPLALVRARLARVLVVAFVAHVFAVLAVGGDWMPYARLFVPVAPSIALAAALLAEEARAAWSAARLALATALGVLVAARAAPAGRHVYADRTALVERARPLLEGAKVIAALDIGWVSAASPDHARLVDLAGLTDPSIALLPGGHTSKRVDVAMLLDRGVDTVLVYSDVRVVESRLVQTPLFDDRFTLAEHLPVGDEGAFYSVYRRR